MGCGSCGGGCGGGAEVPAGTVTEIVIADEREARAVAEEATPGRRWPGVDARGIDQVRLATLWALLSGGDPGAPCVDAFTPLEEVSADGPWVFRIPGGLAEALAGLDPGRAGEVSAAWAGTDELMVDGWEPADARALLDALRGAARAARAARKPLLMRVSL